MQNGKCFVRNLTHRNFTLDLKIRIFSVNSPHPPVARKRSLLPVAITPLIISHINYGVCVCVCGGGGGELIEKIQKKYLQLKFPKERKGRSIKVTLFLLE